MTTTNSESNMAYLAVENIQAHYGNIQALKDISLQVQRGEIVTLIGGNGAGKSTTLKVITGLLKPTSGTVHFNGEDLSDFKAYEMVGKGIAMIPEGRGIFSRLTVLENLDLGAYSRTDRANIQHELDMVYTLFPRLHERRTQVAGTLSGGEQQMLAIGRALMTRPSLLLLDEPSMGLAPILVENIFQTIQDINKEGTTILLVEQNALMAFSIAHRGYVLQTGKIILEDTVEGLKNNEMVQAAYLGID